MAVTGTGRLSIAGDCRRKGLGANTSLEWRRVALTARAPPYDMSSVTYIALQRNPVGLDVPSTKLNNSASRPEWDTSPIRHTRSTSTRTDIRIFAELKVWACSSADANPRKVIKTTGVRAITIQVAKPCAASLPPFGGDSARPPRHSNDRAPWAASIDQQKVIPGVWGARQNLSIWANFQHGYRILLHRNHHKQGDQTRSSIHHTRVGHKAVRMHNPQQMTLMLRVNNLHLGHNKDHLASVHRRHVHDKIHGKQRATQRSTFGMARPHQLVGVEPTAVPNHQPVI